MAFLTVKMTHKDHGDATVPADEVALWRARGWVEVKETPPKADVK